MAVMESLNLNDPDIRTFAELKSVIADPDCRYEGPVYEMFRDLSRDENDRRWLSDNKIRYDITRIPGNIFCGEWVKTKGHYHPISQDGVAFPEIYEVIEGKALYLLQKQDLSDILLVNAVKGDLVLIPAGYGHVTINPSDSTLLMANLVSSDFSSEYIQFERRRGAAYYLFADGKIEKNSMYPEDLPELRKFSASDVKIPESFPRHPLLSNIGDLSSLKFLNYPALYLDEFSDLYRLI